MTGTPRVGLFGGAFDPPHRAHRALVEAALAQLQLDRLLIVPTGAAWHKTRALSPAEHRVAMARLAFADLPRVELDLREVNRPGPSYTIDTLRELHRQWPGATFFLLIGQDQARSLATWRDWQQVLELATVCVAGRPCPNAPDRAPDSAADAPWRDALQTLTLPPIDLSATTIRTLCARGERVDALVGEPVARYIALHNLYPAS